MDSCVYCGAPANGGRELTVYSGRKRTTNYVGQSVTTFTDVERHDLRTCSGCARPPLSRTIGGGIIGLLVVLLAWVVWAAVTNAPFPAVPVGLMLVLVIGGIVFGAIHDWRRKAPLIKRVRTERGDLSLDVMDEAAYKFMQSQMGG